MLTVPWFLARTLQATWAYKNHPIPSTSSGVITPCSVGLQASEPPPQKQQQQQQQQDRKLGQQQQQQQQQVQKSDQKPTQRHKSRDSHQQKSQQSTSSPRTLRQIPVASSSQKSTVVAASQAAPSRAAPTPLTASPSDQEIQDSLKTSKKTLILKPSASGGRMSEQWAQQQVEKFQFDFDKADKDKSGTLSIQEVLDVLKASGFKGSKEEGMFIFSHLDKNKDQTISREEFGAAIKGLPRLSIKEFVLRKAFLTLDKDASGYLTRSEIEDATKKDVGIDIAAEKISALLIYLCKEDKDQKVDYEEFLRVFGVESTATVMHQVFRKLDADNSGFLSKEEILAAVQAEFELKLKAEKISDLLCAWCKDADKKISYDEFVKVWLEQKKPKK